MALSITISVAMVLAWAFTLSVALSDVLAVCIAIYCMALIQFNSLRLITCILVGFLVYDIFWVFISGQIFGSSVMLSVAKGIGVSGENQALPILLTFSTFINGDGYSLLGLGDVLVPGLLLSYLYRVDRMHERMEIVRLRKLASSSDNKGVNALPEDNNEDDKEESVRSILSSSTDGGSSVDMFLRNDSVAVPSVLLYFPGTLVFYMIALFITFLVVALFGSGQPALLYIVPLIHVFPVVRGWKTGQLKSIWTGNFELPPGTTKKESEYILGEGRTDDNDDNDDNDKDQKVLDGNDEIRSEEIEKEHEESDVLLSQEKESGDDAKEKEQDKSIP